MRTVPQFLYAARIHLRSIRTGVHFSDRFKIAVLVLTHMMLLPLAMIMVRFGLRLPNPRRLVHSYRVHDEYGEWEVPPAGGAFYLFCIHDKRGTDLILDRLERGTLLDVGASAGYFTVRTAKRLGDRGRVVAFEPHPERYKALCRNVALNQLTNVTCLPYAVGSSRGSAVLREPPFGTLGFDISLRVHEGRGIEVPLRSLDGVCEELSIDDIAMVKIDVEGFEPEVMRGMRGILDRYHPVLEFEAKDANAADVCTSILAPHGYRVEWLVDVDYVATHEGSRPRESLTVDS